jgi:hypothetical protein
LPKIPSLSVFFPSRARYVCVAKHRKVLKEEDMQNISETPKTPAKGQMPDGTWVQITFTLGTGQYRALRDRAEAERLTVPGLVRETVMDSLNGAKILFHA